MPRHARKMSSTGVYHVMLRGINKQQIMEDEEDNRKFLDVLMTCKELSEYKLYAYCLMGNHLHLLIKVEKEPLELIFKRICGRYVIWFNTKYSRVGHLFQDRFRSESIEKEGKFLRTLRYIHQNPVIAGLAVDANRYPYSSYHYYTNRKNDTLIDVDFVLSIMSINQFIEFHKDSDEDIKLDVSEQKFRLTDTQAKDVIFKISGCQNVSEFQQLDLKDRNDCILAFKKHSLSIRQISRLTGVSKGIVERMSSDNMAGTCDVS